MRDSFAQLMAEELLVAQCLNSEFLFQKTAQLFRVALFGAGRFQIGQGSFEGFQFRAAQLIIEPGRPFFFKRFHKRPSGNSVTSCGHKTVATSPCRWNSPASQRSRDTAFLRFLSSKLLRDATAKVEQSLCRSDCESPGGAFAGGEAGLLLAQSSTRGQSLSIQSRHRTPRRRL